MNLDKKRFMGCMLSLFLVSAISATKTEAGTVKIINESKQNIRVDVVPAPEGASYCKKCFDGRTDQCGKHAATINVPMEACSKGAGYFSMVDVSNGFMGGGKCQSLNSSKNYEVIFYETTLGTDCESKEI